MPRKPKSLVRPLVAQLHAYVPGEQPKVPGLIKLNTNENPYPPAPKVLAKVRAATDQRLRLYPDPSASALREKLAQFHGCSSANLIVGNGSDDILALATRAFAEPAIPGSSSPSNSSAATVQFFSPSYSLYPVLAETHGAHSKAVPLNDDFSLPDPPALRRGKLWDFDAALTFITTPNAPTGRGYPIESLRALCAAQRGVVLLDEAYVDFAEDNAAKLALEFPHVLVARTFSKAYSLCFQRVGYAIGSPQLIDALFKVKDSYNVNGLGQVAALATLDSLPYYRRNFVRIKRSRSRLSAALEKAGFTVLPSQTNFILCKPPAASGLPASAWLAELRQRKILVRWFDTPTLHDWLRITVGADSEVKSLILAVSNILKQRP